MKINRAQNNSLVFFLNTLLIGVTGHVTATESNWRSYAVYQPRIERAFVVNAADQSLRYNHDSSIAWFQDRWFCLWNANTIPAEGAPGQLNYVSTSQDGLLWSAPQALFSDPQLSVNPVPCQRGTQWQPNLLVVDNALWALWSQNSKDQHNGCYLSILDKPDGLWRNQLILFDGKAEPMIDGKSFRVFPTQNPLRLSSGRILAPVTMIGPQSQNAPKSQNSWYQREKRDSVIYSDDKGASWKVSPGAIIPDHDWRQWEPTVCEQPDGTVLMFARNNLISHFEDAAITPQTALVSSFSSDSGSTWTPHQFVPLHSVVSRMHLLRQPGSERYLMIHNDWPAGIFCNDRLNLALFVNRGGGIDYTAGIGLTDHQPQVAYPQMDIHNNSLVVCYSQGECALRNIRVVKIAPLPAANQLYIYPRSNIPVPRQCSTTNGVIHLRGGASLKCRTNPAVQQHHFKARAVVHPDSTGVLFDNRTHSRGLVWGITGTCFVHLGDPTYNIRSSIPVPLDRWSTLEVEIDYPTGRAQFTVNGKTEVKKFKPGKKTFIGDSATLFGANLRHSSLAAFEGRVRSLTLYDTNTLLRAEELNTLKSKFELPDSKALSHTACAIIDLTDGSQQLQIHGAASAGVELGANERALGDKVELEFSCSIRKADNLTLCTIGDANHPARIVANDNRVTLEHALSVVDCGEFESDKWYKLRVATDTHRTTLRIDEREVAVISHAPEANWIYFGEGYPDGNRCAGSFLIGINSVKTRVVTMPTNVLPPINEVK